MNQTSENALDNKQAEIIKPVRPTGRKRIVLGTFVALAISSAWTMWTLRSTETDNAYIRGDVTSLAPKVAGYVTSVSVKDNQHVVIGDILFRIDDSDYRARLAQADGNVQLARAKLLSVDAEAKLQEAIIRQAMAQLNAQVADMQLATKIASRHRELIVDRYISQDMADQSGSAESQARAGVTAASATVEAQRERMSVLASQREAASAAVIEAEALRDLASIDMESTVVRAPVSGVVGNRQVRVGRLVSPGTPLLDIVPIDDLWVIANFKETQLEHLRPGQSVSITIDGYPGQSFDGVVDSFAPGSGSAFSLFPADNATGNFVRVVQRVPVKVRFTDNDRPAGLVPGLSARVRLQRND